MTLYEIIDQPHALAHAVLAVTHFFTAPLDIPAHKRLDVNRYEISASIGSGARCAAR